MDSMYLCLSDMLDQDPSAYEYFYSLSPAVQEALWKKDDGVISFHGLQVQAARLLASEAEKRQ